MHQMACIVQMPPSGQFKTPLCTTDIQTASSCETGMLCGRKNGLSSTAQCASTFLICSAPFRKADEGMACMVIGPARAVTWAGGGDWGLAAGDVQGHSSLTSAVWICLKYAHYIIK